MHARRHGILEQMHLGDMVCSWTASSNNRLHDGEPDDGDPSDDATMVRRPAALR
jgi:hypothetical protein